MIFDIDWKMEFLSRDYFTSLKKSEGNFWLEILMLLLMGEVQAESSCRSSTLESGVRSTILIIFIYYHLLKLLIIILTYKYMNQNLECSLLNIYIMLSSKQKSKTNSPKTLWKTWKKKIIKINRFVILSFY